LQSRPCNRLTQLCRILQNAVTVALKWMGSVVGTRPIGGAFLLSLFFILLSACSSFASTSQIFCAARSGDLSKVNKLIRIDPKVVSSRDKGGLTPLHWAALNGHLAVARALLAHHADVKAVSNKGYSPLQWAASEGHERIVRLLLDSGAEANTKDVYGDAPLIEAAGGGYLNTLKILLAHNADTNATDNKGWTALHVAVLANRVETVAVLLKAKSKVNAKAKNGWTPLHIASANGFRKLSNMLRQYGGHT